ncbi:bone morphogenetic protein receptor type-2-like [Gouania willdenowi]|uniref:bone morphogenetic protein receptor type-2-like n=1 Tax=Gouania willdenowi TaxID=441366 RepID=UPI001056369E|nr:bone morphogenetic protein receptor type-2-like [Gouania willdenowi]
MMSSVMSSALTVCVCILLPSATGFLSGSRLCVLSDVLQGAEPTSLQENVTVRCGRGFRCYGLWEKTLDGEFRLLNQGCWTHVGNHQECVSEHCILHTHTSLMNAHYHFCCCDRDLCNANYTTESPAPQPIRASNRDASTTVHQLTSEEAVLVALATVAIAAILIVVLFLGYRLMKRRKSVSSEDRMEASDGELQLEEVPNHAQTPPAGGVLNERCVAVKLFNSENRQTFFRERFLYGRLPPHHNLVHLLRAGQRIGADGQPEFIIVMEFYSNGCLSQYLSVHSVDWWTMCRMTHGVTLGESKVGVAHRDVSSRNILVRSDLSCVLSDFNLSISLKDTPCYHGDQHTLPIAEVRSVRYLSPEVLGGSVNLRDWGRALKKVDVYALGLMFWESFRRCSDLFTGSGSEGPQVFSPPELAAGLEGSNPAGPQSPGPEPQSADLTPRGRTNPRRAERPRSLDLSSPGLALDVPLSASAEKIKRRVKTPYTLKKWRPASWVVSTDQVLNFNLHRAGTFRMNQSKSSMAVFLVGGGATETTTSDPDGITSF